MIDKFVNYEWNNTYADFFQLVGQTIKEIVEVNKSDYLISTEEGNLYALYHPQDCCESVGLERQIGISDNIIGTPITLAESDHPTDPEWYKKGYRDSYTWSLFVLETKKGRVELWFLGESNGYYGETVDFVKVQN
jgi:hypothetical protein